MLGDKKVLYSGMQSTGNLTLGNYLGALKNWITLSDEYECFYSVANMHSITVRQNPAELRKHARELLTLFIEMCIRDSAGSMRKTGSMWKSRPWRIITSVRILMKWKKLPETYP